jgi:hypothetical protein
MQRLAKHLQDALDIGAEAIHGEHNRLPNHSSRTHLLDPRLNQRRITLPAGA